MFPTISFSSFAGFKHKSPCTGLKIYKKRSFELFVRMKMSTRTDNKIKKSLVKLAHYYDKNDVLNIQVDIDTFLSSNLRSMKIGSIAEDISLMITENSSNFFIGHGSKGGISRCKSLPYQEWNHKYSVGTYGAKMAEIIKQLEKDDENVIFENTDDDGEHFDIWYKIRFRENIKIEDGLRYIGNFEKELESHTEIKLDAQSISKDVLQNEEQFSLKVLLPLFRSMGYQGVKYNHGPREFGKDIIFSDVDELGIRRNFGVQVKAGDITGEAKSELDKLIGQIDDAFELSYIDIHARETRRITDLIIAISGKFTGNAPQKIYEKIHQRNVHFFDIDRIKELLVKYVNKKIE